MPVDKIAPQTYEQALQVIQHATVKNAELNVSNNGTIKLASWQNKFVNWITGIGKSQEWKENRSLQNNLKVVASLEALIEAEENKSASAATLGDRRVSIIKASEGALPLKATIDLYDIAGLNPNSRFSKSIYKNLDRFVESTFEDKVSPELNKLAEGYNSSDRATRLAAKKTLGKLWHALDGRAQVLEQSTVAQDRLQAYRIRLAQKETRNIIGAFVPAEVNKEALKTTAREITLKRTAGPFHDLAARLDAAIALKSSNPVEAELQIEEVLNGYDQLDKQLRTFRPNLEADKIINNSEDAFAIAQYPKLAKADALIKIAESSGVKSYVPVARDSLAGLSWYLQGESAAPILDITRVGSYLEKNPNPQIKALYNNACAKLRDAIVLENKSEHHILKSRSFPNTPNAQEHLGELNATLETIKGQIKRLEAGGSDEFRNTAHELEGYRAAKAKILEWAPSLA